MVPENDEKQSHAWYSQVQFMAIVPGKMHVSCISFIESILNSDSTDAQKIKDLNSLSKFSVDEEKQISKWFTQKMMPCLNRHGYEVWEHSIRNQFSKFGSTILDLRCFQKIST